MNTSIHPLEPRLGHADARRDETVDLDQLLQDYLALNADALDVLVGLYAAQDGREVHPETRAFVGRLGEWERKLHAALKQLGGEPAAAPIAAAM